MTKNNKIKNIFILMMLCFMFFGANFFIKAADINSVLSLIRDPIKGFSLPENIISQANAYLLSHPDINYDLLEAQIINARGIVNQAINGKEINSLADIAKNISKEQKAAIISNLQKAATTANVSIALDQNDKGEESIIVVDKTTSMPIFNKEFIIKDTGWNSNISLSQLKNSLFFIISFIEVFFIYNYIKLKKYRI